MKYNMKYRNRRNLSISESFRLLAIVLFFYTNMVSASSVLNVDLDEMLSRSDFVFEGKAINITVEKGANINQTKTVVEFRIIDVIKGDYPGNTIKIRFAGGTVDGVTLRISGMHYPKLGETGVYFVESLSEDLVHPFYGWSQGHFLVTDDGRVTTRTGEPVIDIVETKTSRQQQTITGGDGVARGVIIEKSQTDSPGMSVDRFKSKLRTMRK